jgi:hypothetical protein
MPPSAMQGSSPRMRYRSRELCHRRPANSVATCGFSTFVLGGRRPQPIREGGARDHMNGEGTYCADFCASIVRFPLRLVRLVR